MCRRLFGLISIVAVLSIAGNASADLILHWEFNEGSGTTAFDSSGNGYDGTIEGGPIWEVGKIGGALHFDGSDDYVVDETAGDYINGLEAITISLWIKSDIVGTDKGFVIFEDPSGGDNRNMRYDAASWAWEGGTNLIKMALDSTGGHQAFEGSDNTQTTEWQHVAMVWSSGNELLLYINGQLDTPRGNDAGTEGTITGVTKLIVGQGAKDAGGGWDGLIDDVQIYNEALTETAILGLMTGEGYPYALGPVPADGAVIEDTWVSLNWSPGDFALSHDVYIGDNFDAVNAGAEGTFQGNQTETFIVVGFPGFAFPDGLVPGTTYYWRIDEINENDPNSPWKGDVWSFMVPPKTGYFPDPADGGDSVALDAGLTWTPGFGAKLHTIYFGDIFDDVNNGTVGLPQGTAAYSPGPLEMAKIYYWRIDEFDGISTYKGNVWSFTTEGAVGSPNPAKSAVDVSQTPVLTWVPGVFADTHEVYFGTDATSLELKGSGNLDSESYEPGQLEWSTTYYWRIDEANNANVNSPWTGPLWSFTTANFLIVDDMESYND
ncbi:MAG: LamG domain-containing protein, partial [Planctomycetes bacterium]|nr:LamG domain-containing protein [Planctomycetota bacterium]